MNQLIKTLVFDVMVKAAIKRLFTLVPLLGYGPIGWIVSALIFKLTDYVWLVGKEIVDFEIIEFKNKKHQESFDKEFMKLKLLEGSSNEKEIEQAILAAQKRMVDLVVYNGVPNAA